MENKVELDECAIGRWVYTISCFVAFIWLWFSGLVSSSEAVDVRFLSNITRYAIAIALFVVVYYISSIVIKKKISEETPSLLWEKRVSTRTSNIIKFVLLSISAALGVFLHYNSIRTLGWVSSQSVTILQWIMTAILSCIILTLEHKYNKTLKYSKTGWRICTILSIAFIIAIILIAAFRNYLPNVYNKDLNWEAFWASAYAQYLDVPINTLTNSFYGYYSVILYPFFKLAGFNVITVAVSTAIQGAFSAACACYTVWYITRKNNFIRLLGILAVLYFSVRPMVALYPQGFPARLVFTTALMAAAAWLLKTIEKRGIRFAKIGILLGYLIAMLGMMWSKDFGLVGIVSWTVFHTHLILSEHKFEKCDFLRFVYPILTAVVTFFFAWQIISLINQIIWKGDPLSLSLFMYPVGSGFTQALSTELMLIWSPWIAVLLLLFWYLGKGIATTSLVKKYPIHNPDASLGIMVSVLALGMMVYYINRTAYDNLSVCYYAAVVLIVMLMTNIWASLKNTKMPLTYGKSIKRSLFMFIVVLISVFIVVGSMNIPTQVSELERYRSMDSLEEYTQDIKQNIPEGAMYIGVERTLINSQLEIPLENVIWSSVVNFTPESWQNIKIILISKKYTIVVIGEEGVETLNYWVISKEDLFSLYKDVEIVEIDDRKFYVLTP